MATKEQLEELLKALLPILEQLEKFEKQYGGVLREYKQEHGITTEEERTNAAIQMIRKYSNL